MLNTHASFNAIIPGTREELGKDKFYEFVYRKYWEPLYYHASKMTQDADLAKDILQDVFLRLWKEIETVEEASIPKILYTRTKRRFIDLVRKDKTKSKHVKLLTNILQQQDLNISSEQFSRLERQIAEDIKNLPEKMRKVFELSYYKYLSYSKIAEQLATTEENARKHFSNAMKILKAQILKRVFSVIMFLILLFSK